MRTLAVAVVGLAALLAGHQTAAAQAALSQKTLNVELNKFEEDENGSCRAFFLFRNNTDMTLEGFEMSLAIFDAAGVIDRLLSVDAAPLPAGRTTLKLFEIPDIQCSQVSEILLHEVPSCRPQNDDEMDCFPILGLSSKTSAALVK